MATQSNCLHCKRVSLIHTGAYWICPSCGLMITKHALAEEIMRADKGDGPGGDRPAADGLPRRTGD